MEAFDPEEQKGKWRRRESSLDSKTKEEFLTIMGKISQLTLKLIEIRTQPQAECCRERKASNQIFVRRCDQDAHQSF